MTIADVDTAAAVADDQDCPRNDWATVLTLARTRLQQLRAVNPSLPNSQAVHCCDSRSTTATPTFTCCVASPHGSPPTRRAHGLTPRQVPLPGVHAKWLNTHQAHVATLADFGRRIGLATQSRPRIHFTYLDPDCRPPATESTTPTPWGTHCSSLPADPRRHFRKQRHRDLVSPNSRRDRRRRRGQRRRDAIAPIRLDRPLSQNHLLGRHRRRRVHHRQRLPQHTADPHDPHGSPTYLRYAEFGTNHYPDGRPIPAGGPTLPYLTDDEAMAYSAVTAPPPTPGASNRSASPCRWPRMRWHIFVLSTERPTRMKT